MKFVLVGAGSAQFGLGTLGDFFQCNTLEGSEIVLVDIDERSLGEVQKKADAFLAQHQLPFTVTSTTDRKQALQGATFVVISIEVGNRFALWDEDWTIPQQYGFKQIYGENGGPGGVFHALRITPVILDICKDVAEICPEAWVFNYSNPMTAITTAVLRRYPEMKFVGLCHEVLSLERYLPAILETPFENLKLRSGGLNHFSVLLEAAYVDSQTDAYPDILQKAPPFFEKELGFSDILSYVHTTGNIPKTEGSSHRIVIEGVQPQKPWADRTLYKEILQTYHLLPITVDSHFGEYIQWAHDVADHKGIKDFYTLYREQLSHIKPAIELHRDERLVLIIEGIITDSGYEEPAVNVMNKGLIPDLPSSIAVEVPATVHAQGLKPISFSSYPKGMGALLRNYCGVYDLTVEAILTKKKEYVIQALLANPIVTEYRHVRELVEIMIERQKKWLAYLS